MNEPLSPVGDGRDGRGRFSVGNTAARGNPYHRQVAALRNAMLSAVTPEIMAEVVAALIEKAKSGDVPAIRELLDRVLGKGEAMDLLLRVETLERGEQLPGEHDHDE
jgi:hypothetical protein